MHEGFIIFSLDNNLTQESKRPKEIGNLRFSPLAPNPTKKFPNKNNFGHRSIDNVWEFPFEH